MKKQEDFYLPKIRYDVVKQMGFIKHAFVLTFYFLLVHAKEGRKLTHFDAIKEVISLAGLSTCLVLFIDFPLHLGLEMPSEAS